MHIRADSQLHALLRELHEQASDEVAPHIFDALEMMGTRSPFKGGRKLVDQLEFAEREAKSLGDRFSAEGLQDAIHYADGRLLEDDLDEKYDLYDDSGQDRLRGMSNVISATSALLAKEIDQYLEENPGATGADVSAYYRTKGQRAIRFIRSRRSGHYGAFRINTDLTSWTTEVLADRTEFLPRQDGSPDPGLHQLLEQDDAEHLLLAAQVALRLRHLDTVERVATSPFSKSAICRSNWKPLCGSSVAPTATPAGSAG